MSRPFRTPRAVAVALCLAAAVVGFALGRATPPPQAAPTPAELAAAIRTALGGGDALERLQRTTALLEQLNPDNLVEVAAVYDQMRPVIGDWEVRPFIAAWARFDPGSALDHAMRWAAKGRRAIGVEVALESWALLNPAQARQAVEEARTQHPRLSTDLVRGLVTGWARSDAGLGGLDGFLANEKRQDDAI